MCRLALIDANRALVDLGSNWQHGAPCTIKKGALEMWVALAQFKLQRGDAAAAGRALAALAASGAVGIAWVCVRHTQAQAELAVTSEAKLGAPTAATLVATQSAHAALVERLVETLREHPTQRAAFRDANR